MYIYKYIYFSVAFGSRLSTTINSLPPMTGWRYHSSSRYHQPPINLHPSIHHWLMPPQQPTSSTINLHPAMTDCHSSQHTQSPTSMRSTPDSCLPHRARQSSISIHGRLMLQQSGPIKHQPPPNTWLVSPQQSTSSINHQSIPSIYP